MSGTAVNIDEVIKKPLYVFVLPQELLVTLHLKDSTILHALRDLDSQAPPDTHREEHEGASSGKELSITCQLCHISFSSVEEQRSHIKSDWHNYNLKAKLRGGNSVTENEFEQLVDDLNESLSGSGSESTESEDEGEGAKESTLTALLKKQAKIRNGDAQEEDFVSVKRRRGAGTPPLLWFTTPLLPSKTLLGIYRGLFTNTEQDEADIVSVLRGRQIRPVPPKPPSEDRSMGVTLPPTMTSPTIFMCMVGGGHFAGMVVSLAPKLERHATGAEQRKAIVIAHKTFHRYTTRRKQGGAQSSNDSARGAANSAGAQIRRYNETALELEIRALLAAWKDLIGNAQLIFVRATGSSNRRILFGPYESQVLRHNDPRNRTFPFSTRRATQAELMRSFVELTRVKVREVDEAALAGAAAAPVAELAQAKAAAPPPKAKPSREEEEAALHTSQLQALIRRSKAPAIISYLSSHSLSANYDFHPASTQVNHHTPTPLHLASSINSPAVVLALLTKAGADPTYPNGEGKPAFVLAGNRATRDAFRVARSELGEGKWDWNSAHVPPPLSKVEADIRDQREKCEAERAETERRKMEEERMRKESPNVNVMVQKGGKTLGAQPKTAEEKRMEEARGMTPEMRTRVERERRARAAEERIRRLAG